MLDSQSHVRLRLSAFWVEFLNKSIDSWQSYLLLRIDSFWIELFNKSMDSGHSYLRLFQLHPKRNTLLPIGQRQAQNWFLWIAFLTNRIDSGQSCLRFRIGSLSIEVLKESIDSGQSDLRYLRHMISSFPIGWSKGRIVSGEIDIQQLQHGSCLQTMTPQSQHGFVLNRIVWENNRFWTASTQAHDCFLFNSTC